MKEEIRSNLRKLIAYEIGIWSYKKKYMMTKIKRFI
jgi:hypothetical protein